LHKAGAVDPEEEAMSGRQAALTLALAFTAPLALAQDDRAVPRGGGSSGSSAGSGHHSGASSSSDRGSSGGSSYSGGGSSSHEPSAAERRHPRAGTGTGFRRDGRGYYGGSYYYDPYRYSYFYGPSYYGGYSRYWGYSPYYYSGAYGYSPYSYGRGYGYRAGALRILVEPNETRVYVDGYYAGIADDFDGIFQRLNLAPGRHDISLRLDGYRTQNLKVYVPYDQTIKIHHRMLAGSPSDVSEEVVGRPEDVADLGRGRYDDQGEDADRDADRYEADDRDDADLGAGNARGERGTLRLAVRPADASVYVDGAFRGTGRLRSLSLVPGRHRIEIVRPGYRTVEREVDVQPGRRVEAEFDLERN
jgi:PEGA domain-containing protein